MDFLTKLCMTYATQREYYSDYNEDNIIYSINKKNVLEAFNKVAKHVRKYPEHYNQLDYGRKQGPTIVEIRDSSDIDNLLKPNNLVNIRKLIQYVNKTMHGKVFLGRVLVKPFVSEAICFVAEDAVGNHAIRVMLYNNPISLSSLEPGTFFAMLDPSFVSNGHGCILLRSDDPNELITLTWEQIETRLPNIKWKNLNEDIFKPSEPNPIAVKLRKKGNNLFGAGKYREAIKFYTNAIHLENDDEDLLANRSICYLRLENYQAALNDALLCLEMWPFHVKATYRAGQAYMGLGQYEKALDLLKSKSNLLKPSAKEIDNLMTLLKERIKQRDYGIYNMVELYKSLDLPTFHDIAEFIGPVKIGSAGVKGRGLFLTRDVEPGQLLLCVKAFAIHLCPKVTNSKESRRNIERLLNMVVEKLTDNPEKGRDLYKLWAGKQMGYLDPNKDDCTVIDRERIRRIIKHNAFEEHLDHDNRYALVILPSYINNDCVDNNCHLDFFGDICQLRSSKQLKKGEELLITYSYRRLSMALQKDFECQCALCQFEKQHPNICFEINLSLASINNDTFKNPEELEREIKKIRKLSEGLPYAKYYLSFPLYKLAKMYIAKKQMKKALKPTKELLTDWRKSHGDNLIMFLSSSVHLFESNFIQGDFVNAKKNRSDIMEIAKVVFGSSNLSILEVLYPRITELFRVLGD